MAHTYLLEIGLEEMPAHVVTPSIDQLVKRASKFLKEQRITFDQIKPFSTPRRLTLEITGLADKQTDIDESVKGPAKKIAKDADGNWTKAAIGFSKGQGATPDDIQFKEIKGTEYVFIEKHIAGKPVADILPAIKDVITSMTFPTRMKWNVYHLEYIRPIRWLVSILDNQVVPFSILDVEAGRTTRGHRFLGHDVEIENAADYEEQLEKQFVIVDAQKRKAKIQSQVAQIASDKDWDIKVSASLLEEVNNLVEWPTAFAGNFDPKYLSIPAEVLITSMRDNQRFFYVVDHAGKLLPHFVAVRNGDLNDIQNVVSGNEKVLTARLEDAMFFYQEDQKHSIDFFVDRLKRVSFHDRISTMYEKMERVQIIVAQIAKQVGLTAEQAADAKRAAQIYKFDLVTEMVGEFAELQGVMGEKYALLKGEKPAVATAIREHYLPDSASGQLPETAVGAALALADKFDSIMTFFAAGMIPSGSNDPYALRRQAIGIVRILNQYGWTLPLSDSMEAFIIAEQREDKAPDLDQNAIINSVIDFIKDRIINVMQSAKYRHDIIEATVNATNNDVLYMLDSAKVLSQKMDGEHFKEIIEALSRVVKIATKANFADDDLVIDPSLFNNDSEKALYDVVNNIKQDYFSATPSSAYEQLAGLAAPINDYFEQTMVMDKDESIKNNNLRQMTLLSNLINWFAAVERLIVK
ncbi:glycine--tRNA ligase subunit beta [Nicoliella spurrieriana]|uniref:Glycine--tRNA ligase beta subunit n=1 Tax=Nicoliella spurrieriana TaxID=2925830 RepID=A0A976RRN9_9LACO|nr:glycine--tRNA ligase subunit beta [Nicoliella spurrieriana]UQS86544.1 glycine--tRNA ligase subunit beta [Nicoliella spurrieriana]